MLSLTERISNRILEVDNFENVAHVCCDWEEFVFEVAEWGVQSIAKVDFDSLTPQDCRELDNFIASFGCSPLTLIRAVSTQHQRFTHNEKFTP